MVFFGLSLDLDGALFTKNVQTSLQRMLFFVSSFDLNFLDDVFGISEGALVVIILMALLMVVITTFLPCPAFQINIGVGLRQSFEAIK